MAVTHLNVLASLSPTGPIFQVCVNSRCGAPIVSAAILEKATNVVRKAKQYEVRGVGGISKAEEFAEFNVYMHAIKDN